MDDTAIFDRQHSTQAARRGVPSLVWRSGQQRRLNLPDPKAALDGARDILAELKQKYVASEREAALGGMQEKARASADMALVDRMVIRVDPGVVDLDRAQREALRSRGSRPAN